MEIHQNNIKSLETKSKENSDISTYDSSLKKTENKILGDSETSFIIRFGQVKKQRDQIPKAKDPEENAFNS